MTGTNKSPSHWGWKASDLLVKALIPIALAAFAFLQHDISIQNQMRQQETATDLKVLEIAWPLLVEPEGESKSLGLSLIRTLRPELATQIASVVSIDEGQPDSVREQALRVVADAGSAALGKFKVDIYYDSARPNLAGLAARIESLLRNQAGVRDVVLAPRAARFFNITGRPLGNEVRYEPGREENAARALVALLNTETPSLAFRLRSVHTRTAGTISIFLVGGDVPPAPAL
jgi:hypothetical protein